jgi:hypothetical protein
MTDEQTTSETSVSQAKDEIIKESKRIEEDTLFSSKGHFFAAGFWSNFHLWVGLPTAVLAAVASGVAWDGYGAVAGAMAIAVAGLTAIATFTNPNDKANAHLVAGNNYDALRNRARIFWTIDCWQETSERVLTEKLKDMSEEKNKLNRSCPQIPGWAYRRARQGIEGGEAEHATDK